MYSEPLTSDPLAETACMSSWQLEAWDFGVISEAVALVSRSACSSAREIVERGFSGHDGAGGDRRCGCGDTDSCRGAGGRNDCPAAGDGGKHEQEKEEEEEEEEDAMPALA